MLDRLTITSALIELEQRGGVHLAKALDFAIGCQAMIDSLEALSFPVDGKIQVVLTDNREDIPLADLVLDPHTARLLHAALGAALGAPAPDRLATT